MRWIYLSPHLDDAALSAGGWLHDQIRAGHVVEIWTFMCGYPPAGELSMFAQYLHQQWGMSSAQQVVDGRRAEDQAAAALLGAKPVHFDFLDCIYRKDAAGDWLYVDIFVDPLPGEADLPAQIAAAISARLLPEDELVCQFGVGKHVDHVTVRRAAELLGRPLHYVADIPYYFNTPEHLAAHTAGMKQKVETVGAAGLQSWKDAILAYESQISSLFESPQQMKEKIDRFLTEFQGFPIWQRP